MWTAILIFSYVLLAAALAAVFLWFTFLVAVLRGAPFIASDRKKVERLLRMADMKPGERLADLGSGDGRIVLGAAGRGARAVGYEINPMLVWWSRMLARRSGLDDRARFLIRDFWKEDLASYDVVTVFGIDFMMDRLGKKLKKELRPGARVLSNGFSIPGWEATGKDGQVLLYTVPSK